MEFSSSKKKEECQHDEYCAFSEVLCVETDFQKDCKMKDTDIEEMSLLKSIKERVNRDNQRKS